MKFNFFSNEFTELENQPHKLAISASDVDLNWHELKNKVEQLSELFNKIGIPKGHPVLIYGHKEHFFPVSILACFTSGITYVPIDVIYPPQRIEKIIEQTGSQIAINCTLLPLPFSVPVSINSEFIVKENSLPKFENYIYHIKNELLQYIMFTSGSTGEPKGVQITRNNIISFVHWATSDFGFHQNDVFLNQAPFSFDVSLCDIINAFSVGGSLVLTSNDMAKSQEDFINRLIKYRCTVWTSTPSFIFIFLRNVSFVKDKIPSLKKFLFMGEELPNVTCKKLKELFPECSIYNAYGPTEATIVTTLIEITDDILAKYTSLPIGYCRPDAELFIDFNSADKKEGELIINGPHVSAGYFKNESLNNLKFFTHNNHQSFRTGDLSYQTEGLFFFLGRNDDQVKLHGFRIEINEINHVISTHYLINDAVTIPLKRNAEVKKIISFVILNRNVDSAISKLTDFLKKKLPYYMVPSEIIVLEEFPYNASHKVDKNKLIEFYATRKG